MSESDSSASWPAYAAAVWSLIFGIFHVMWALGWYVALDAASARAAFSRPWFLVYDLAAAAICALAIPVALALARPWKRHPLDGVIAASAWTGTVLLVLRSGVSLLQIGYLLVRGRFEFSSVEIWEAWFYVGAVLFLVSTLRYWRLRRAVHAVPAV